MATHLKRIFVGIAGGFVLLIGIAMIVLPGPALIVIPTGLAILATQFEWARRLRDRVKDKIHEKKSDWKARHQNKERKTSA
ncbi:MAG: PGPGW domain-containing protein [Limisphaerales bacterium]